MSDLLKLIGKQIFVEISGRELFTGILIDVGKDILVLFDGDRYLYQPLVNIHRIGLLTNDDNQVSQPDETSFSIQMNELTLMDVLNNAKGGYTEIYVTGKLPFQGYIVSIQQDYFTFYSPVQKMMSVSLNHLKWLTPYPKNILPFTMSNLNLPIISASDTLENTFEKQLNKMVGSLVIFDGGNDSMKIGWLKQVKNKIVELTIANGETLFHNLDHLKTVHLP
jgi:hypothetical protein